MTRNKLYKLRAEWRVMYRSPQKARPLESLARRLGRKPFKRGKEPVWVSKEFAHLYPVAIPHHGGRDLPLGTRDNILAQLEMDLIAYEQQMEKAEHGRGNGDGNGSG